jgi:hypothetical protein
MNNLYAISIIPPNMAREPGSLSTLSLHNAKENLRQSLTDHLPLSAWAILAWDISMNHDETRREKRVPTQWQLHLYGVVGGVTKAELERALHRLFPKSPAVPRPVQIKEITDPYDLMAVISYAMKSGFTRRISYTAPNGRIASRKVGLKSHETAELMSYLAQYQPTERLLLFRVRRWGTQLISTVRVGEKLG